MSPTLSAPFFLDLPLSALLVVLEVLHLTLELALLAGHPLFFFTDREFVVILFVTQAGKVVVLVHSMMFAQREVTLDPGIPTALGRRTYGPAAQLAAS